MKDQRRRGSKVGTQRDQSEEFSEIVEVRGVLIRLMGIIIWYVMGSG